VDRLVARCDEVNERSMALAKGLGFHEAGTATIAYPDGSPRPVRRLELGQEDYRRRFRDLVEASARRATAAGWRRSPPI
jgi:RimJ/RimL family protein N-acetyltransferase